MELHGVTLLKIVIFVVIAVRNSDPNYSMYLLDEMRKA
jgi:hypothetical protein